MVYGPYVRLPEASYEAEFVIRARKGDEDGRHAKLAIEVVAGDRFLNLRDLEIYSPFANAHRLSFAVDHEAALCDLEFRLWVRAGTYIELTSVRVTRK